MPALTYARGTRTPMADTAGDGDPVLLTLREAAAWLDPPITLRTLYRITTNAGLTTHGTRTHGGRPAALYALADLYRVHATWVEAARARGHVTPPRPMT